MSLTSSESFENADKRLRVCVHAKHLAPSDLLQKLDSVTSNPDSLTRKKRYQVEMRHNMYNITVEGGVKLVGSLTTALVVSTNVTWLQEDLVAILSKL
jgi:hypothetical protein